MFAKAFLEVDGLPDVEQAPPGTPHYVHDEWGVHEGFGGRPSGSRERGRQQADAGVEFVSGGHEEVPGQDKTQAVEDEDAVPREGASRRIEV